MSSEPPCRTNSTPDDLAREADRSVLYGAVLAAQRPGVRLKPTIAARAEALLPAVRAYLDGEDSPAAVAALTYAQACGAEAFLIGKRAKPTA
jgi:hypothetical protein